MSDRQNNLRICLFGGTFDPIHTGHTHIAAAARSQLDIDRVIFLPCKQSPHKTGQKHADAEHRLAMCHLATEDLEWAEVSDYDLTAPAPSYSWRTAEVMKQRFPDSQLFWLMGSDQWEALHLWNKADYLSQLVEFIVFQRGAEIHERKNYLLHRINGDHPASATVIRQALSSHTLAPWLDPLVSQYIESQQLYRTDSSLFR
ncbi:MAG: nicotinate (nicotinamide) nucleotide adenylyltransferase [Akkermansiaceae bacterium]